MWVRAASSTMGADNSVAIWPPVPVEICDSPVRIAAPSSAAAVSAAPVATGMPSASPSPSPSAAAAEAVRTPAVSLERRTGGSHCGLTPYTSHAVGDHTSSCGSQSRVAEASDASVAIIPVNCCRTQSLGCRMLSILAKVSGSCWAIAASVGPAMPATIGLPPRA